MLKSKWINKLLTQLEFVEFQYYPDTHVLVVVEDDDVVGVDVFVEVVVVDVAVYTYVKELIKIIEKTLR